MDRQQIATVEPSSPTAATDTVPAHVAGLLRDTSMRVLEAALAIGALATALVLGLGR